MIVAVCSITVFIYLVTARGQLAGNKQSAVSLCREQCSAPLLVAPHHCWLQTEQQAEEASCANPHLYVHVHDDQWNHCPNRRKISPGAPYRGTRAPARPHHVSQEQDPCSGKGWGSLAPGKPPLFWHHTQKIQIQIKIIIIIKTPGPL